MSTHIKPLQELVDVVQNEVVFEDAHHVRLFIVNEIVHDFHVFKLYVTVCILPAQIGHYELTRSHEALPRDA